MAVHRRQRYRRVLAGDVWRNREDLRDAGDHEAVPSPRLRKVSANDLYRQVRRPGGDHLASPPQRLLHEVAAADRLDM